VSQPFVGFVEYMASGTPRPISSTSNATATACRLRASFARWYADRTAKRRIIPQKIGFKPAQYLSGPLPHPKEL